MSASTGRILIGDALEMLRTLPDCSVHAIVTSPPYWGLRDYGVDGQIGLEATPAEHVSRIVAVFREARRVLRDDGTAWINYGDCYATGAGKVGDCPGGGAQGARWRGEGSKHDVKPSFRRDAAPVGPATQPNRLPIEGLKPKDLVGMPWRVAFALQADGWYLRSDIIWHKPNPMPESVTDRPTKSHEYLFLLAKSERYYYDSSAIREDRKQEFDATEFRGGAYVNGAIDNDTMGKRTKSGNKRRSYGGSEGDRPNDHLWRGVPWTDSDGKRNARTVWTIPTEPFSGAHFATFPRELIRPCIRAGAPRGGVVLDPFFGSGTTGVVCDEEGRDWVGIELSPKYAAIARGRTREKQESFE